jgi:hypothetical protein
MRYAEGTSVPVERSKAELEKLLVRYGADQIVTGTDMAAGRAQVGFRKGKKYVRFVLPLPNPSDRAFSHTPGTRKLRSLESARQAWEGACRQRWRALLLVVKAKLEAVDAGISSFDEEFLAHLVLPDGRRVGEVAVPQLEVAYRTGQMPALLELPHNPERNR